MFLGLGAYSVGLIVLKGGLSLPPAVLLAVLICLAASVVIGYLCLRGDSMTFGLLHLGFNRLLSILVLKWISFLGGEAGIMGIPRPTAFSGTLGFYFLVLIVVSICYGLVRMLLSSPFARATTGLRENEERLRFLGVNIRRFQLVVFVISGFFAAISGILLAMLDRGAFPAYLGLTRSAEGLMMCLIGGMYTFLGPSIGAAIVVIIGTVTSTYLTQWQGLLGIIIIACVIGFQGGILRPRRTGLQSSRQGSGT